MTILASVILDEVSVTLIDVGRRTWKLADLLGYLNEAIRMTAGAKADFFVVNTQFQPVAGIVQTLPTDGITLTDVPRNTGGRIITQCDKGLLDEAYRFWPTGTQVPQVEHFTVDPRDPLHFMVYPPNDGNGGIDIVYSAVPPVITAPTQVLPVLEVYQKPLTDFVLGKAYQMNTARQDLTKSSGYIAQWGQGIGLKSSAQAAAAAKVSTEYGTT